MARLVHMRNLGAMKAGTPHTWVAYCGATGLTSHWRLRDSTYSINHTNCPECVEACRAAAVVSALLQDPP